MDCHLVSVEVRIERGTSERVELDGLSFDHSRLESLNTESVKSRCTVKENRMTFHHVLEDIPDDWFLSIYNFLCRLDCLYNTPLDQLPDNERFVKLCSHKFRKAALMHLKFRTYDDD